MNTLEPVTKYLDLLGFSPTDFLGVCYYHGNQFTTAVLPHSVVSTYIAGIDKTAEIWIGVNPVGGPMRIGKGRGKAEDVTRLTALYCDIDVKAVGCDSFETGTQIINDLSGILGTEPTLTVMSGHGWQPYWVIEDGARPTAEMAGLLARFGRMVRIVADSRNAKVDSVFDLARILRAPGTFNNKDQYPIGVEMIENGGAPLAFADIEERMTEYGVLPDDSDGAVAGDIVSPSNEWQWATEPCAYVTSMIASWLTEPVGDRHPWALGCQVRLESARRYGCVMPEQYQQASDQIAGRLRDLRASTSETVKPNEIRDIRIEAERRAACKSNSDVMRELGDHTHWMEGLHVTQGRSEARKPPRSAPSDGDDAESDPEQRNLFAEIFEAEDDFWTATTSLKQIYETSMARMVSPWAVLAYCVARILQLAPPSVRLPALIGGRGSLNWFALVCDASGGGKSAAAAVAKELVQPRHPVEITERNPGSGEGIIGQYYKPPEKKGDFPQVREAVMFTTDEIDTLTAMGQRQGGTTLSTLRTAFSGGTLGFSYITRGRDIHVKEHTYRMTFVVNAQPSRCGGLLADHGGGTPQRFQWFPANDPRPTLAEANEDYYPAPLPIPGGMALLGDKTIEIPSEARHLILSEREKAVQNRGGDILDGHALFVREKFAFALALLDGRTDMGSEDWRLSGIAAEVSSRTRLWVQDELAKSQESEAKEQGRIRGIGLAAADSEKSHQTSKNIRRVEELIIKKLKELGPMTAGALRKKLHQRDRHLLDGCLAALSNSKEITVGADGKTWAAA